jgi:hypothetical protein
MAEGLLVVTQAAPYATTTPITIHKKTTPLNPSYEKVHKHNR